MAKCPGSMRRGTKWYLRVRVPTGIVDDVGRSEIRKTSGTGDHRKAVSLYHRTRADIAAQFEAVRGRRGDDDVTNAELRRLVTVWFERMDRRVAVGIGAAFDDARREALAALDALDVDEGVEAGKDSPRLVASSINKYLSALARGGGPMFDVAATAYGKRFARFRPSLGITGRDVGYHSFRHTVADRLRNAGVELEMRNAILGHARSAMGSGYGRGYSVAVPRAAIRKIDYDLDLGHLCAR